MECLAAFGAIMAGFKVVSVSCLKDGDIDLADLRATVERAQTSSEPVWLEVFRDEGRPQPAQLLLVPGVPIALIPVQD